MRVLRLLGNGCPLGACLTACLIAAFASGASARIVSGTVTYGATGQVVSGAVVKAYDVDTVGREYMGQATTTSQGAFSISYSNKNWDFCCGDKTRPDIQLEVWIGGQLWLKTGELASNVGSDRSFSLIVKTPKISGTVRWAGSTTPVVGATIRAYDDDVIGRELMGSTTTSSSGSFNIVWNPSKEWDSCCGDTKRPDIEVEVWYNGVLWATSSERSNTNGDIVLSFSLTRILVTGTTYWEETCKPAAGVAVVVKDDDTIGSETMASGSTSALGSYAVSVPNKDEGKNWDLCCNAVTNPDVFSEFSWAGKVKGKTSVRSDVSVPGGSSLSLSQGTTWLWRGDATSGAAATQKALGLDTVDWVEVEEYNSCSPRQIRLTFVVNFQREGDTTASQFAKLKSLTKLGISENWSRTGNRSVLLSNGLRYDVVTQVAERSNGKDVELEWVKGKECKRSNNVGEILGIEWDPILYYNEGCAREKWGADWESNADYNFRDTSAHEFGHSVLLATPPANIARAWYEKVFLTKGQVWSWTHKRTSNLLQEVLKTAPTYPATGDWDIMLYYNGKPLPGAFDRSFAVEDDVRKLVAIAGKKGVRGGSCACPLKK